MEGALVDSRATVARLVPGKTFADIGGLWGVRNEKVSVALKAGATAATMVDIAPLDHDLWDQFRSRLAAAECGPAECVSADACAPGLVARIGQFDVVHSAGLIYHLHSPYDYLLNLRDVFRESLVVTSMIVPDVLQHAGLALDLAGGRFLSTHGLDASQRRLVNGHFDSLGLDGGKIVDRAQCSLLNAKGLPHFGPWWWFFTAEALRRMLHAVGLSVVSEGETWPGRAHTFHCCHSPHSSYSLPHAGCSPQAAGASSAQSRSMAAPGHGKEQRSVSDIDENISLDDVDPLKTTDLRNVEERFQPLTAANANYLVHVSGAFRYAYFECPKVACSTIKHALQVAECAAQGCALPEDLHNRSTSPLLSLLDGGLPSAEILDGHKFFRFAFVRNPYSRALSMYLDKFVKNTWERERLLPKLRFAKDAKPSFCEVLERILTQDPRDMDVHWTPQRYLLGSGRVGLDFVGRLENFAHDFDLVRRRLLPAATAREPAKRVSPHQTNSRAVIEEHVGRKERELIRHIYRMDFVAYSYGLDPFFARY